MDPSFRYDRQVRLWGEEGQTSIQETEVCVLGSSALATEILKNLVLAGIKSFHVVDDAVVNNTDLGKNFFVTAKDVGSQRAEVVTRFLKELNPSVDGSFTVAPISKLPLSSLLDFSVVISANQPTPTLSHLANGLYEAGVPLIITRVCGLLGSVRLVFPLHTIFNTHEAHPAPDLRLDRPLPELLRLSESMPLQFMDKKTHSHTPYVYVLLQALDLWRTKVDDPKAFPASFQQRKELTALLKDLRFEEDGEVADEQNFTEAKNAVARVMVPTEVPSNVKSVFVHPLSDVKCLTPNNATCFWVLAAALKLFYKQYGVLPLSGEVPDMTSDSARYAQVVAAYRTQAQHDSDAVFDFARFVMSQVFGNAERTALGLTPQQCKHFCKHAAFIGIQEGTPLRPKTTVATIVSRIHEEPVVNEETRSVPPLSWLILLEAVDSFFEGKNRLPGTNGVPLAIDSADLTRRAESLLASAQPLVANVVPPQAVEEICRYGASELHAMAAIIGGIVAQEAIKLTTHQYVPIDNTFIYDGHTQNGDTIRL